MISLLKSKFNGGCRRAILLSTNKLVVYNWEDGRLTDSYMFDVNEEGRGFFDKYLKDTGRIETYFVVDLVEEEYRQETLPHVFGRDRQAVIKRKKDRLFRDTPYYHADIQGRMEEGRRDDRVLFTALTNPEIIQPWISILLENKTPLAGIYSVPQLTSLLLDILPEPSDHMLVVSLQGISGLRQTFFHKKELKISRLVDMPRYGTAPYAPVIKEEVEVITRYLNSLRLIDPDKPYDVYFLGDSKLLNEVQKEIEEYSSVRYHMVNVNLFGRESGLEIETATPFSDQLLVYHLLKERPGNYYALKEETHYFRMDRVGTAMYASSICLILASMIWGGTNFTSGLSYKRQGENSYKLYQYYSERLKKARMELEPTPVNPYELKTLVEIANTLDEYKTSPADIFTIISRGMDRYPQIELNRLEWQASMDPNTETAGKRSASTKQGIVGFSNLDSAGSSYAYYQIAMVEGVIKPFEGDYRKAIEMINGFADSLKESEGVQGASVVALPLDTRSEASLSGTTGKDTNDAEFSVRLVLGVLPHERK